MKFYEVWVSSQRYHGAKPLTYSHEELLSPGVVVSVPLGPQKALGIISQMVSKPSFATKPITKVVSTTSIPRQLLQLHAWLMEYYPGPSGLITQLFLPSSLGTTGREKHKPLTTISNPHHDLPNLTHEQSEVISRITAQKGSFLLHGDTGTGKTRVYVELAQAMITSHKSALILTPEIGLTPQLINTFEATFPGQVVSIHSTQTPAERRNSWLRIHNAATPLVVIGPRSALFTPLKNIGVIVADEAHDSAYKQEQMPYYQATRVAAKLATLHDAQFVLGTATPLVHDYYTFAAKDLPILRMTETATPSIEPIVEVIDLKEREQFPRSPWLSKALIDQIETALNNGNQSLIFLNRRGTARLVLCQNCGWQAVCPHCDLPLTYHGDHHHLRCHTCGFTTSTPGICPTCSSTDIQFKSVGTKTIANEVARLFPKAAVQRFDSDTKKAERLEQHYESIKNGEVDILVGTQMLSKGLDLPRLAVVGVVVADTSLYFPDYTAEERTFQMLRQVIGRVGRGHTDGHVVVQTYYPDSPTIQAAVQKNYDSFYESQLKERELYRFPPYYFVLKIGIERATQSSASKAAQDLAADILKSGIHIELSGPTPAFLEKTAGRYHWQIIIKAKARSELLKIISILPKNCSYDIDPSNLL